MARYVYSPFTPIADRWETSHRAGWALYCAHVLGAQVITTPDMPGFVDRVAKTDEVFLYHGMEFKDALNFPGGMPEIMVQRAHDLTKLGKRLGAGLISLDREMPDYAFLMEKQTRYSWSPLKAALVRSTWRAWPDEAAEHLIIGDSHSLSQFMPGARIYRNDSLTLHGALKKGLLNMVDWCHSPISRLHQVTFYFGNIDIRHHLCRYDDVAVEELVDEYYRQVNEVRAKYRTANYKVVLPLPIEDESRVLPKTGWFKGTPFFGSWDERNEKRKLMAGLMLQKSKKSVIKTIDHPYYFINELGQLKFEVMEKPRSVHLAPQHYRLIQEGGAWTGV